MAARAARRRAETARKPQLKRAAVLKRQKSTTSGSEPPSYSGCTKSAPEPKPAAEMDGPFRSL